MNNQLSPDEQKLIQQIKTTSRTKLDVAVRDAIREQMLHEFRALQTPQAQPIQTGMSALHIAIAIVITVIALLILVTLILLFLSSPNQNDMDSTSLPSTATQIIVPSSTLIETETVISVTQTVDTPASEAMMPSTSASTPEIVIIEGPVENISNDAIAIYDFSIQLEPDHPILQIIQVGDIVRVEGEYGSDGIVMATVINNIPDSTVSDDTATVGLDGPVEAINENEIVVNGISIQLSPDDPLLQALEVGNFITVQGNFQTVDSTITLIVVNITVVNNVSVESNCWYHDDGMGMGHWHCDGMGMGGMGMGDDGMGAMGMGN